MDVHLFAARINVVGLIVRILSGSLGCNILGMGNAMGK